MLTGTIALVVGVGSSLRALHLENDGIDVMGSITGMSTETHKCRKYNRSTCTSYKISYRFTPKAGQITRDSKSVEKEFYRQHQIGKLLPVRYFGGRPTVNEIELGSTRFESWIAIFFGAALWTAVGHFGSKHVASMRGALILREQGVMRRTRVTEVQKTNIEINDVPMYRIVWDGPVGKSWAAKREKLPEVGEEISVFEHPDRLLPAVWEGDVGSI